MTIEDQLAILREALERIAKEQVTYYESTAPGTASLDSYATKQRPTEAATIAREALFRAGMGEANSATMAVIEDARSGRNMFSAMDVDELMRKVRAPQPEARSCSNCSSRFPSEQDLDDPAHPCRCCRQFDGWTPEAGEGGK